MKTKLLPLLFLITSSICLSQVPSINVNNNSPRLNTFSSEDKTKLSDFQQQERKLEKEIKSIKKDDSKKAEAEAKLKTVIAEKNKILEDNYRYKVDNEYYNNQIAKVNDKIEKLKKDSKEAVKDDNRDRINGYEKELKELDKEKTSLEVEKKRKLNPTENNYNWFLPSKNREYRNAFFQDTYNNSTKEPSFLNAFAVVGSPNGVTGQSEIVADNMKMLRVTFGTVLSATNDSGDEDSTTADALQRLLNGGGNFYIDFTLPLATTIKDNNEDLINLYSFADIKAASDIKGYGNDIEASTYNTSLGLNLYTDVSTENRRFNFFVVATSNYYYGCTKEFYENLGIDHNHGFLSGKITVGLTLLNQFRFSATVLTYGSEPSLRAEKISAGLQFLPKL